MTIDRALDGPARDLALEVLIHGPLSRRELATRLAVSPATLTRLSSRLIELGVLAEREDPIGGLLGRPARPLDIVPGARHFVGMKITDTGVLAVLTNLRAERLASHQVPLADLAPEAVARVVGEVIDTLRKGESSPIAVGISLGGQSIDNQIVNRAPFLHWADVPFAELVRDITGLPTVIENDVIALTAAEHWFGVSRNFNRFAVITIGIGVGYGLVMHDRVVTTPDAGVGLLGHHPLEAGGPLCPAGHRGCAEAMLSIPAIEAEASAAYRRPLGFAEVIDLARTRDPLALVIVERAARALGRLIAAVANITMAEHVLVTGEGIDLALVAREAVDQGVTTDRDPAASAVDVAIQANDVDEWARGAAAIAIQHYVREGMPPDAA